MTAYDVVVRGGMIVDGTGSPAALGDIGINGDRITAVGDVEGRGTREIDASSRLVTPGFIDAHTHMDAQVFWDPLGSCSSWHGVTSVVMGHCGFTLAPARPTERGLVVRNLERAEDIPPDALAAGVEWTWESVSEYLAAVSALPKAINYAGNVGHSALRTWVMGEAAFERAATEDEVVEMARGLEDGMRAGAIGFTSSRSDKHQTSDGRPVASRVASWDEVVRLVSTLGDLGAGIFQMTNESRMGSGDDEERSEYLNRVRSLATSTHVPFAFGVSPTERGMETLDFIDDCVVDGARMTGLAHSRGVTLLLSFETQLPFDRLSEWETFRSLPLDEQARQLRKPEVRQQLVYAAEHGNYGITLVGAEARPPDYTLMYPVHAPLPPYRSVADLAAERHVSPVELMIDLALEQDLRLFFAQPVARFDPAKVVAVMRHPHTAVTFSDSGAHVSQISDCSLQTHLLAYWVREREAFTMEEGVRMLTSDIASRWGFDDRGVLRPGAMADINVIDPEQLQPELPYVGHDLPGGAQRIVQRCRGIDMTMVSGQPTFIDGEHTGALPGQLLRGPLAIGG